MNGTQSTGRGGEVVSEIAGDAGLDSHDGLVGLGSEVDPGEHHGTRRNMTEHEGT